MAALRPSDDEPCNNLAPLFDEDVSIAQQTYPPDLIHSPPIPVPIPTTQFQPEQTLHELAPSSQNLPMTQVPSPIFLNGAPDSGLRNRIHHQRVAVRSGRETLDAQRSHYVRQRDHFDNVLNAVIAAVDKVLENKPSEEIRELRDQLRKASESLRLEENRTKEQEHHVSTLEYWLDQDEEALYSAHFAPVPLPPLVQEHDMVDGPSPLSPTPTLLRETRQHVEFLHDRLEELDYEHQQEISTREAAREAGHLLEPLDEKEFEQKYESWRANIQNELAQAKISVQKIEYELDQPITKRPKSSTAETSLKSPLYDVTASDFARTDTSLFSDGADEQSRCFVPEISDSTGSMQVEEWLDNIPQT